MQDEETKPNERPPAEDVQTDRVTEIVTRVAERRREVRQLVNNRNRRIEENARRRWGD